MNFDMNFCTFERLIYLTDMHSFGSIFQLTTFGESHGLAIGGVVTGVPAGIPVDVKDIQKSLDRRKPGQSDITTPRKEKDQVEILSGVFEGKTTGTPIGFMIKNEDQISKDYDALKDLYRPSHADFTYQQKYGIRDYRGGGRASARETACRVVAGSIALQMLHAFGVRITAYVQQIGEVALSNEDEILFSEIENNKVRCPNALVAKKMENLIEQVKQEGDSLGGIIKCIIQDVPVGLGLPTNHKLQADLGAAMLGVNAVKGFDYGLGFDGVHKKGSEVNDVFVVENEKIKTKTNYSGGIQGGISNGMDIYFRVAFKPTATIQKTQETITSEGESVSFEAQGRHDPCVLPRAVPIVEAMAALVIADHVLLHRLSKI